MTCVFEMFVRMTMFLMTMAMGVGSGGIIMRMRMVIMAMRTMRMVVAMGVIMAVSFGRRREVVDKWDGHWV